MAWLEIHQTVFTHHKTVLLSQMLDVQDVTAAGTMIKLWLWAMDNAEDGDLSAIPNSVLAYTMSWTGNPDELIDACCKVGYLDRDGDSLHIHNWEKYAGRIMKKREQNAAKARKWREKQNGEVAEPSRDGNVTDTYRDYSTVQYSTVPSNGGSKRAGADHPLTGAPTPLYPDDPPEIRQIINDVQRTLGVAGHAEARDQVALIVKDSLNLPVRIEAQRFHDRNKASWSKRTPPEKARDFATWMANAAKFREQDVRKAKATSAPGLPMIEVDEEEVARLEAMFKARANGA